MRVSQRWIFGGTLIAAAIVVAALVLASQLGDRSASSGPTARISGVAASSHLLAGIPQHGNVLGRPDAPVTLVEYADLQCPYCGDFARNVLPQLVNEYVRPGHVKLVFRGMAFLGDDSTTALRAVLAAGADKHLWDVTHLIYVNQGVENTGWVTDEYLRSVMGAVPGLDPERVLRAAREPRVSQEVDRLQALATADGISGTPSFSVGRSGSALTRLQVGSIDAEAFRPTLDELLGA